MDIGLMIRARFLPEKPEPLNEVYARHVEDAVLAEELGFDFVRTSEHHFAPDAWMPSQIPVLATIAGRTSRVRLGTNVLLIPFHHPLRLAEDVATLDILSNGRVDLAVGVGSIRDEFESFDLNPDERWGRMFEALDILRKAFAYDSFDHKGKYFNFPDVRLTTKPVQDPLPLWVGAVGPKTNARAAKEGYHLAGGGGRDAVQAYRDAGRDPDQYNSQSHVNTHVADTTDKAWDESEPALRHHQDFYTQRDWIGASGDQKNRVVPTVGEFRHQSTDPVGSPDDVLKKLETRFKESRTTHLGFAFRHASMPVELPRDSMRLFAREVMPELRKWGREPVKNLPKHV